MSSAGIDGYEMSSPLDLPLVKNDNLCLQIPCFIGLAGMLPVGLAHQSALREIVPVGFIYRKRQSACWDSGIYIINIPDDIPDGAGFTDENKERK